MFVIQVTNQLGAVSKHYWMNSKEDDFLRFLPKNFGVHKEALRVWMFEDEEMPLLEGSMKALGEAAMLDLSTEGVIKAGRIVETPGTPDPENPGAWLVVPSSSFEMVFQCSGVEVGWPYSSEWKMSKPELGTFLGFQTL